MLYFKFIFILFSVFVFALSCSKPQEMMFDWANSMYERGSIGELKRCLERHNRECKEIKSDICQDLIYRCTNENTNAPL
jgi:hypothetical protein